MQEFTAKETEIGGRKLKTPNPNWNVVWRRPKGHSSSLVQWKSEVKEMLKLERLKIETSNAGVQVRWSTRQEQSARELALHRSEFGVGWVCG